MSLWVGLVSGVRRACALSYEPILKPFVNTFYVQFIDMWAITRERGLQSLLFPDELPFQSGKPFYKRSKGLHWKVECKYKSSLHHYRSRNKSISMDVGESHYFNKINKWVDSNWDKVLFLVTIIVYALGSFSLIMVPTNQFSLSNLVTTLKKCLYHASINKN